MEHQAGWTVCSRRLPEIPVWPGLCHLRVTGPTVTALLKLKSKGLSCPREFVTCPTALRHFPEGAEQTSPSSGPPHEKVQETTVTKCCDLLREGCPFLHYKILVNIQTKNPKQLKYEVNMNLNSSTTVTALNYIGSRDSRLNQGS